ncbi:MAG: response regulator [Deltaproteobacteria bacterium]|nr:response regulator [Deltaproteobacteria bacterium]
MQPRKILLVEDSKLVHKMYEVMLRQYPLVHAFDGRDALTKIGENPDVDLILLDINMPHMNGLEFLAQVKSNPAFSRIHVVIVSTEGKEDDTVRALKLGASAYIKKPFRNEALLEVIARLGAGGSQA